MTDPGLDRRSRRHRKRAAALLIATLIAVAVALGTVGAAIVVRADTEDLQSRAEPLHHRVRELTAVEVDAVRSAVERGLRGDLAAYNVVVDQRATLDSQHDTALEALRTRVNTVITALDELSRTSP